MTESSEYIPRDEFDNVMVEVTEVVSEQFQYTQKQIESIEILHANLMLAYIELNAATESMIQKLLMDASEEEKAEFREDMDNRKMNFLKIVQDANEQAKAAGNNDGVASAVADMAKKEEHKNSD